jgi:pyruvate,water dikinase
MEKGDVLVAPFTDAPWTPLFLLASAVVVETGGLLSHAATVAREYGIPAVVMVKGATALIADGQTVTVDGSSGEVCVA